MIYIASISTWDMVLIRQTRVRFKVLMYRLVTRRRGQYVTQHRVHGSTTVAQICLRLEVPMSHLGAAFGVTLQTVCTAALSVHPLSEQRAKEFYMVFGQLFTNNTHPDAWDGLFVKAPGVGLFSFAKFLNDQPDLILTNGMAFKYLPSIGSNTPGALGEPRTPITINSAATLANGFKVKPGELTRWYIFNAGPNDGVAFHFIGTYQDEYYGFNPNPPPGHLMAHDLNDQDNWIPPADGQVIEAKFPPSCTRGFSPFDSCTPRYKKPYMLVWTTT